MNIDKNKPYIYTTSEKIAEYFRGIGLHELPKVGDKWGFVNDYEKLSSVSTFSGDLNGPVHYTNMAFV